MQLKLYQIDAFANKTFEGNPAAVVPLESWIGDDLLQSIAAENNLSETAFFVKEADGYRLRWFTPEVEVDMCGHATLASAYVLFECMGYRRETISFQTRSGLLRVKKEKDRYAMDFPLQAITPCAMEDEMQRIFGVKPLAVFASMDYIVIFEKEEDVLNANPDMECLKKLDLRGVCISAGAKGKAYDFVLRFFAPKYGIEEDPVTGSALTQLVSYWSKVLQKEHFLAKQVSERGGEVQCEMVGDRVLLKGRAVKYLEGAIDF
jgi:PhzF family phenazine biosynthesis protein